MTTFIIHAAWTLTAAFVLSFFYEVYRATVKAGVSQHDSVRSFILQVIALYLPAAIIITLMFGGREWAAWVGLVFSVVMILVSIFYYNPKIMLERRPGILDWFEDLVFTGLLFVAAAQLIYAIS